jgi:hypothetical protein
MALERYLKYHEYLDSERLLKLLVLPHLDNFSVFLKTDGK